MLRKLALGLTLLVAATASAFANPIHDAALFTSHTLPANDDDSTGLVNLGFQINFFGNNFSQLYVNNNGNVTFDHALNTYTPFELLSTSVPMLAPFFADVDTRNPASSLVQYGQATLGGHSVFGVNWIDVGYYKEKADKTNSFQLIVTNRADTGAGNFDFQYNYANVQWETGSASSGSNGLGGDSARAGWSNGTSNSYEFNGSAINGALLNGGANSLIDHSLNSNIAGQYNFQVRNGNVVPAPVPEPETYGMLLGGLALLGFMARRKSARRSA
ncbi:MAG TPA: VPLPA-CTERM sorting domain-containing protein [Janthinobacterium sp.]|nr:VPLPA-CTERM sorting domain-containing protein [Janthinobacterium sp.]